MWRRLVNRNAIRTTSGSERAFESAATILRPGALLTSGFSSSVRLGHAPAYNSALGISGLLRV
jgi:hypothetical protein